MTISSRCQIRWALVAYDAGFEQSAPKLEEPAPHALIGNIQAPLHKQILHISIAKSEPSIEPNGVSNDLVGNGDV